MLATRMRQAASNSFPGPFDAFANIGAAFSTRRLLGRYTGDALLLRRDSDNVELAFGFTGAGDLDTSAISTWLGGANGYVVTWYDQSGGGYHRTQTTAAAQPLYVPNIVGGKPIVRFDGSDDTLTAASHPYSAGVATLTTATVIVPRNVSAADKVIMNGGGSGARTHQINLNLSLLLYYKNGSILANSASWWRLNTADLMVISDDAANMTVRRNGTNKTGSFATSGGYNAMTTLQFGAWGTGRYAQADFAEVVLFTAIMGTTDRAALETNIGAYYGITIT